MHKNEVKFGLEIIKFDSNQFSIGFGVTKENWDGENEIFIWFNLFKWCLNVGWFIKR